MPLKDKEKRKDASKARMQKMRNKGVTKQGVTDEGVTTVPASYVEGIDGKMYEALPERPRYLELSDGVLDRLNQPFGHEPGRGIQEMQRCNESSYNYKPNESSKERVKAMVKEATR